MDADHVYDRGHLDVGHGHRLYYERYGTPGAVPVVFVHGGPGAGFTDEDKDSFDPARYDVLLYEQRGAGRSEPFAGLEYNHTDALVGDLTRLLDRCGWRRAILFGGSWGATLSLVYAVRHPDRVAGLVLRGVFLADRAAINHFLYGGAAVCFPEAWERFVGHVPPRERHRIAEFYLNEMLQGDGTTRERLCYEWARYELSILSLDPTATDLDAVLARFSYRSLAPLEAHYVAHGCFLPEGYLLERVPGLAGIPAHIVQGRYDMICPAPGVLSLHRAWPGSMLEWVVAGHAAGDPAMRAALPRALANIAEAVTA